MVVNMDQVNEAHSRVDELVGRLQAKQAEEVRSGAQGAVAVERAALEAIQARVAALRQVGRGGEEDGLGERADQEGRRRRVFWTPPGDFLHHITCS